MKKLMLVMLLASLSGCATQGKSFSDQTHMEKTGTVVAGIVKGVGTVGIVWPLKILIAMGEAEQQGKGLSAGMAKTYTSPVIYGQPSNKYGSSNNEYKYKSTTGSRYKYDLSKPTDRIMYDVDPAAKVMDGVNPRVNIDRNLNQYGGGIQY